MYHRGVGATVLCLAHQHAKTRPHEVNVIKIRPKSKNQDQEQVIEKIACSFLREIEKSLDKQFQMCGEAP